MKKYILLLIIYSLFPAPHSLLYADSDFSLRIAPALQAPLAEELINPGIGANVSLDWAFWDFAPYFTLGANAGGAFASLPVQVGDPLTLFEGNVGLFLRWRPSYLLWKHAERWAFQAGMNGGLYQYSRGENSDTSGLFGGSLGAQFHLSPYFSLYAEGGFTRRAFASRSLNTFNAAIGLRLNLSEIMGGRSRVNIEKTQQHRVFPVSWAWYEHNPVAMVQITNDEPNTITDVNISFFMDSYMSRPWTFAVVPRLTPGESIELPVTALFNEAMMNLTETVNANGVIQMQYRSLGARKETATPIQMPIFHRNTLSWDDDRRAAAFVSPRDSAARMFARHVASAVNSEQVIVNREGRTGGLGALSTIPANVVHAAALFEALRLYGISYVVVPATSFAHVSADESALDNVSFPYQALYYRGGDCSYLAILFCSMLEALDIASAFITIPGHIYIAVEVGDDNWQVSNNNIIELEDSDGIRRRWLPIEITVPGEGFTRAWRIGAQQWHSTGAEAELIPIREAWQVYPPVTAPSSGDRLPQMPGREEILRALQNEIVQVNR